MAKLEQLSSEIQCVQGLVKEAKKVREREPALETTTVPKVLKGGKPLATRSRQKKADEDRGGTSTGKWRCFKRPYGRAGSLCLWSWKSS